MNKDNNKPYWLHGKHAVLAALNNPNRLKSTLLVTQAGLEHIKNTMPNVEYTLTDNQHIKSMVNGKNINTQGIALNVKPLSGISINDLIKITNSNKKSLIIALDQISDPHNLGAIMRSALAFGVDGIIISKHHSVAETNVVAKSASGALDLINIVYAGNLSQALDNMRKNNYWIIGLDGGQEINETISSAKKFDKIVLVLGSENEGMRRLTQENCDLIVKIPISSQMESLNVSNAAAVAMYELQSI